MVPHFSTWSDYIKDELISHASTLDGLIELTIHVHLHIQTQMQTKSREGANRQLLSRWLRGQILLLDRPQTPAMFTNLRADVCIMDEGLFHQLGLEKVPLPHLVSA